jgi:heterotetrameric sarcosine oxidase gamma subunit
VASVNLSARSALHNVAAPGRCGARRDKQAAVVLTARTGLAIAHIVAGRGSSLEAQNALAAATRLRPVDGPSVVAKDGVVLIGCAPGQWLAVAEASRAAGFVAAITQACATAASVTDQTSARAVVRVTGARARDALAKGCPIDLHARVFQPGDAAATRIAHVDCMLWQVNTAPTYDIAVDRSIAASFWAWLTASAAEYGYQIAEASRTGFAS